MTARWYAGQTKPNQERTAHDQLDLRDFVCYVPRVVVTWAEDGQVRSRRRVMFKSYVFVKLDLTRDGWQRACTARGLTHLLPTNEHPWPLPVGFVETLRAELTDERTTLDQAWERIRGYVKGDVVDVIDGLLKGQSGEFVDYDNGMINILFGLLGRPTMLQVPAHDVAPRSQ